jgi:hypothetical protein
VILVRRVLHVPEQPERSGANVVVARKFDVLGGHAIGIAHADVQEYFVVSESHAYLLSFR